MSRRSGRRVAPVVLALLAVGASGTRAGDKYIGTGVDWIPEAQNMGHACAYEPNAVQPLVISFNVSGLVEPTMKRVELDLDFFYDGAGDLGAILAAPGGAPSLVLFKWIGYVTSATLSIDRIFSDGFERGDLLGW